MNIRKLDFPWRRKRNLFEGTRAEILEMLKKLANPNCNSCYGRGYIGYTENKKNNSRDYIPCPKCVNKKVNVK